MSRKNPPAAAYVQPYRYPSPNIPMRAIRRFARQIAERFQPEKIILFGSYAYGTPHAESDVDIMVIMPAWNDIDKSIQISLAFEHPFSLDLVVCRPQRLERELKEDDRNWFLYEVVTKGKVLYEARNGKVGSQGRRGLEGSARSRRRQGATARPRGVPLSAIGREIPEGAPARPRRGRAKDA
jgi:predicted nucleotidyltransferase